VWDGIQHSYLPPSGPIAELPLPSWVGDSAPDPITFEVVRHRVYTVNEEQGMTIVKVSGSPVATFAHDFATSILSARGEAVYFGPYNQHQVGTIDLNVKWILAQRAANPGIANGDMFLGNDPWIGANHQSDVVLVCPVFYGEKLLCWIASVMHTYDVGGSTPGSFCPDARSVYDEPLPTPPIKLVDGGVVRRDVEEMFLRRSRLPELVALDLRALVASNQVARRRITELADRYSPAVIAGVLEKVIVDAETRFGDRLERIPDGEWTHSTFIESAGPGDRGAYELRMRLRKFGRKLVFDNEGTHPQVGCLNTTVGGWRSGIVAAATPLLGFDLMHATGGIMRCIDFDPTPGTIFSADYPGAVSNPQFGVIAATDMAVICISKMLATSGHEDLEKRAMAGPSSLFPVVTMSGTNRKGRPFGTLVLDPMGGGLGALSFRDGEDTGGQLWDPVSTMPNVEYIEQYFPVLYYYRRMLADSGGAGRLRGGNSGVLAFTPHKVDAVEINSSASGWAVPTAAGLFGGLPGCTNGARLARGPSLEEQLRDGRMPQSLLETGGAVDTLAAKQRSLEVRPGDVYELWWSGGGGFGDPFERDEHAVLGDIAAGRVTREAAQKTYGVAVDAARGVDAARTAALRSALRRVGSGDAVTGVTSRGGVSPAVADPAAGTWNCSRCGHELGSGGSYLDATVRSSFDLVDVSPHMRLTSEFIDTNLTIFVCRCAGCGVTVDSYLASVDDGTEPSMRLQR